MKGDNVSDIKGNDIKVFFRNKRKTWIDKMLKNYKILFKNNDRY